MTEAEWSESSDPVAMLGWLMANHRPSDRKLRLAACAIARSVWEYISDEYPRRCVSWAERLADDLPTKTRCADAASKYRRGAANSGILVKNIIGPATCLTPAHEALGATCREHTLMPHVGDQAIARAAQAHILRDIIGNPWKPVTLPLGEKCSLCKGRGRILYDRRSREPAIYRASSGKPYSSMSDLAEAECGACCGTGHGPSPVLTPLVLSIAQAAYTERNPDGTLDDATLAILADALEEAGMPGEVECDHCDGMGTCYDPPDSINLMRCHMCDGTRRQPHPLLAALRSPGPHHPGFWALGVVMGRE